jgi:hypothetical protein
MTMMVGESGQKKNGAIYRYYKCASAKRKKGCDKKAIRKEWIEDYVINKLLSILDDSDVLNDIANANCLSFVCSIYFSKRSSFDERFSFYAAAKMKIHFTIPH